MLSEIETIVAELETDMTIIRDGRNTKDAKDFTIVGVGGAGAKSATELAKVLGSPEDVISVDREMDDLRSIIVGRRIAIGYPVFVHSQKGESDDDLADVSDLFRLKTAIGKPPITFVMAGLGGNTTLELMPSVIRTAMSTGATVLAIVTLPFAFEGRTRSNIAGIALDRILETGCPLAMVDADAALSNVAIAGDLASELAAAKARVVMNVLSTSGVPTFGTLNTAPELLDAISGTGPTFISYASCEDVVDYRKATREAIKNPITSGLELSEADCVSVIVSGPRDMSVKALNSAIAIVQGEVSENAVLSTSFVASSDASKGNRMRISILAGKRLEQTLSVSAGANEHVGALRTRDHQDVDDSRSVGEDVDDLFGAPEWLIDNPSERDRVPVLL